MKKLLFLLIFILMSCSQDRVIEVCPNIIIPRDNSRSYITYGSSDALQVNLIGFEAYCYNNSINRRYAKVTPMFKIRRLENSPLISSSVNFYLKEASSKHYSGYNFNFKIPEKTKEAVLKAQPIDIRINNINLEMGILLSGKNAAKSRSMFDIDYKYLSPKDIDNQNSSDIPTRYLEVGKNQKVIYSDTDGTPKVVDKNYKSNPCSDY